ncbi:MAG: hypothetical protein N2D54_03090, partial [Chloroflexota bacterium]
MTKRIIKIVVFGLLSLMLITSAFAQSADYVGKPLKGTVTAVDEVGGTFTVEADDGTSMVVVVPEGFDWTSIAVGNSIQVHGDANEDGTFQATKVQDPDADDDDGDGGGKSDGKGKGQGGDDDDDDDDVKGAGKANSKYCSGEEVHPIAAGIAEKFDASAVDYTAYFCDENVGFGRVMMALQTSKLTGMSVYDLLALSKGDQGWGKVWKEAGLIGNAEHGLP